MSALLPAPLAAPAELVEVEHDFTPMHYSRTLCERSPHIRSSQVVIVPMADPTPRTPLHQKVIYAVCLIGAIAALVFNNWSPL